MTYSFLRFRILLDGSNLIRRGVTLDSVACPICLSDEESVPHIFFRCNLAQEVLRRVLKISHRVKVKDHKEDEKLRNSQAREKQKLRNLPGKFWVSDITISTCQCGCKQCTLGHSLERTYFETQTKDGFLLGLQRVSTSTINLGVQSGPPVLLLHGLFMGGDAWFMDSPNESLGFVLADRGFDVWVGNVRGTKWSHGQANIVSPDGSNGYRSTCRNGFAALYAFCYGYAFAIHHVENFLSKWVKTLVSASTAREETNGISYNVHSKRRPFSWGPAHGGKGALPNVETLATSDKKEQTALHKAVKG
ncbi:triacylglycerol lipase 1 [Tanacetum coccineum]